MSSTLSKWLAGCGIGCGVIVLGVIGLSTAGYMFVKSRMQSFEDAQATVSELQSRYGRITEFCPDPDGRIRPERMKTFLTVREALAPARRGLESSMTDLSEKVRDLDEGQEGQSLPRVLGLVSRGFGVVPRLGEFQLARVRTLRDAGMAPGEYLYIYVVSYYAFLSKSPSDGPDFETGERGRIRIGAAPERAHASTAERAHDIVLPMLRNQRVALHKGQAEAVRDPWAETLEAEIKALESDDSRVPWMRELPKQLKDSLEPYREELQRTYSPLFNPFELEFWERTRPVRAQ